MSAPLEDSTAQQAPSTAAPNAGFSIDDGVPIEVLEKFPLSASVRGMIAAARQTARNEDFRGLIGTGLTLICLERAGDRVVREGELYAPNLLAAILRRMNGAGFTAARKRFFDRNRREPNEPVETMPRASHSLMEVFERAMALPRYDGILASRHLTVALLLHQPARRAKPTSAWEILSEAGIDREALLAEFLWSLSRRGPEAEQAEWAELARQHPLRDQAQGPPSPAGATKSRGPTVPGYGSDTPTGRPADDCLNLQSMVGALAHLIVSPQLEGNLSLGVFGNWGSGKSFFMRRLRGAISELTTLARDEAKQNPTATSVYWPNVVQVEFNAWHYIDANLWASLMSHLLGDLRRWEPEVSPTASTPLRQALEKLCIATEMREEADRREREARQAKDSAESLLHNTRIQHDGAVAELAKLAGRSVWSFVEEQEGFGDLRQQVVHRLASLNLQAGETADTLESIYRQLCEVNTTAGTLETVTRRLLTRKDATRQLAIVFLMVVVPLLLLLALSLTPARDFLRQTGVWLGTSLVGLMAACLNGVRWIQGRASEVMEALAPLRAARRRIESGLAAATSEKAQQLALGERKVAAAQAAVESARLLLADREQQLRGAIAEVNDAISGRAITRFIEQRLSSGDYQKHLGLIALIRRDFEHLSDLVRAHNAQRRGLQQDVEEVQAALLQARPDLTPAEASAFFAHLGINRIVLYIDDLDRCPSNRVVEVLQAIHLLLSFEVFVVVVGVDSRWMAHSLAKEYPALLARTREEEEKDRVWSRETGVSPVTPSDYLEKIFQIPLWVPPLDATAAKDLIGKLSAAGSRSTGAGPEPNQVATERTGSNEGGAINDDPALGRRLSMERTRASDQQGSPDARGGSLPRDKDPAWPSALQDKPSPEPLVLSDPERKAMLSLAVLIGRSPRATRRFVNSYRLFRAALAESERLKLGEVRDGLEGLAAPMLLLAVVTGAPAVAARVMAGLRNPQTGTVLEDLVSFAAAAELAEAAPETVRRIREFARAEDAERWRPISRSQASNWMSRVAQFSFEDLSRQEVDPRPRSDAKSVS